MKSDGGLYVTSILTSRTVKIEIIIFYKLEKDCVTLNQIGLDLPFTSVSPYSLITYFISSSFENEIM